MGALAIQRAIILAELMREHGSYHPSMIEDVDHICEELNAEKKVEPTTEQC